MSKIKLPNLRIKTPGDASFWRAVAVQVKKEIRIRTETNARDYRGRSFKSYSPEYVGFREKRGRSVVPNLSFSGKMLGGMIATATRNAGVVRIVGEQAAKAWGNEQRGRVFFRPDRKQIAGAVRLLSRWMARKNRLR